MSEMLLEVGDGFLSAGETLAESQNRLIAACSAWNMACGPPEDRQRRRERYAEGYLRLNPGTPADELVRIVRVMNALIERKLRLFPDRRRQVVYAEVVRDGAGCRIEIASAIPGVTGRLPPPLPCRGRTGHSRPRFRRRSTRRP
jgi:hypothetical protein